MKSLSVFLLLTLITTANAQSVAEEYEVRYHALIQELRCLVCQNQNIAESNAPLAVDLKEQVAEMLQDGRSDTEIKDYLLARYGDFVLYRPPFKPLTWILWLGPFVLLAFGLFLAWKLFSDSNVETEEKVDSDAVNQIMLKSKNMKNRIDQS